MPSQRLATVDRAMQVLFFLAKATPVSIEALSRGLGAPKSTMYRYVASLKAAGLVQELPGGHYALGPRCVQLDASFQRTYEIVNPHREAMAQLAQETGETVALLVPLPFEAVCVAAVESEHSLRYTFHRGAVAPMLRGASAKVMLPYLPKDWVERLIEADTELTETQKRTLQTDIPKIRERGYAVSQGEVDAGVWAVGAPVFRPDGSLEGAISTIAPDFRIRGKEHHVIQLTVATAKRMSDIYHWELNHAV